MMDNVILINSGKVNVNDSNFYSTMKLGVSLETITDYIRNEEREFLEKIYPNETVYVWGLSDVNEFANIKNNDFLWFCSENNYHSLSRVALVSKLENPKLSNKLWGTTKYPFIIFSTKIVKTNVSRSDVQTLVGFKDNYTMFGARYLNNEKSERLIKVFDLVDIEQNSVLGNGSGKLADSDSIAVTDSLGRENMINNLSDFYIEFTKENKKPFFMGIFAGWGRGKSSFIEMLTQKISNDSEDNITHVISKIDTSLMDKKDTVWLTILTKIIQDIDSKSKKKHLFKSFFHKLGLNKLPIKLTRLQFNILNIKKTIKIKRLSIFSILSLIGFTLWMFYPYKGFSISDGKNLLGWISLCTLIFTSMRTIKFKINDVLIPTSDTKIQSSYFKSKNEFNQLIKMLDKNLVENHSLRVLIILDEVDRINKTLVADLVEVIQQLKGLQDTTHNKNLNVTFDFLLSFNHKIVFPSIGKEISLGDKELLTDSLNKKMISSVNNNSVDTFKLGKEYMDKYLDLSIYLDKEMDINQLIDHIYIDNISEKNISNEPSNEDNYLNDNNKKNDNMNELSNESNQNDDQNSNQNSNQNDNQNDNQNGSKELLKEFVINNRELQIIKKECKNSNDPRKIIRLKNAIILLKMINSSNKPSTREEFNDYYDEFQVFISTYLNENLERRISPKNKDNNYLKHTHYFFEQSKVHDRKMNILIDDSEKIKSTIK